MALDTRKLRRWYRDYNHRFFGDSLPADALIECVRIEGCWGRAMVSDGRPVIHLSPRCRVCRSVAKMTLLHEMAHVKLWPVTTHGPQFQAEMQRLAAAGAMKGLW